MRRTSFTATWSTLLPIVLVALLLLAGCGGGEKDAELGPLGDETASAEPSAGSSADPAEPSEEQLPFDDEGHEVVRGTVDATTPEQEAVAEAWLGYWGLRLKSFGEVEVEPMMGSFAAADALADVVRYVATLRSKGLRTVGDLRLGVTRIDVQGTSARLASCGENKSVDREPDGTAAEALTPFYNLEGTLTQAGGSWRVVDVNVVGTNGCRA